MTKVLEHDIDIDEEQTEKPPRPFYRKPVILAITAAILLIAVIAATRYYVYSASHESTDDAFIEAQVVQVSPKVDGYIQKIYVLDNQAVKAGDLIAEIDPGDFQVRVDKARAALEAAESRQKSAGSNVALTKVNSDANVEQATYGVDSAKSAVDAAQAQVNAARGKLTQSRAQVATALANAEQARAQEKAAEADQAFAQADVQRYQELFNKDEVSKQRLDQSITAARTAEAQVLAAREKVASAEAQVNEERASEQAARAMLVQAESQVGVARAQVGEASGRLSAANSAPQQVAVSKAQAQSAGADVGEAKAAVDQAELELSYTKIYASETGHVTRKAIQIGTYVQAGQALMAIVPGDVWVTANFKETQLDKIRPGQPVEITVDAYPGKVFNGHVDSIQAGSGARFSLLPPENATGNFVKVVQRVPVKILFDMTGDDQKYLLGPGMSAVPEVKVK
jgi:membrane fusion protein (multidrug efflux system)